VEKQAMLLSGYTTRSYTMFRQASIAVSLLLLATTASANGFYLGLGAGPGAADFQENAHIVVQPAGMAVVSNARNATHLSGTGMVGSLFGGYGVNWNAYYLAGEVNASYSTYQFKTNNSEEISGGNSQTKYRLQSSYGISLLPGFYYMPNTLFYTRVGYENGNFKTSTTDVSLANVDKHLNGFRCGLGVKQTVTRNMALRMDYSHIAYQNTTSTVVTGTATKRTQVTPTVGQVEISLVYDFV
jgi:outer membrane immunogenic protein